MRDLVGDEHLAGSGDPGEARSEVDGGTEEVTVALDGGAARDTDAHGRVERRGQRLLDDPQPRGGSLGGVSDPHHDRVAERLDDMRVGAELTLDTEPQAPGELGSTRVAVSLREGGEADDVREQKSGVADAHRDVRNPMSADFVIRDRLEHGHSLCGAG